MKDTITILAAIHAIVYQGERILGKRWLGFVDSLRRRLQQNGFEDANSTDEMLLFTYNHPYAAITSIMGSLEKVKQEFEWPESQGVAPLQIVLHLVKKGEPTPEIREATANIWERLSQETIHLTRSLKQHWEELMNDRELPGHSFKSDGMGLFRLEFSDTSMTKSKQLFPYRQLPSQGGKKECFYCGMTNHQPQACPSRYLAIDIRGADVGYLPFARLNELYQEIFTNFGKLVLVLKAGIKASQLRENATLQVLAAYFDIFRLYQLRFLKHISFSTYAKWESINQTDKIEVNCRSLLLGLDSLRVGQYGQAEELFFEEIKTRGKKQFYSTVGMAFCALERGKMTDCGHFLERAATLASQEKERVYIRLLLSRYYELISDLFKAGEMVKEIFTICMDCSEAQYRRIQLMARTGFSENDFKLLRSLTVHQKESFMTVMMDPTLLPVHGLMEDLLNAQLQTMNQSAKENLTQARTSHEELRQWFGDDDPQVKLQIQALTSLEKQYDRKSYYDIFDIIGKSKTMVLACHHYKKENQQALNEKIEKVTGKWQTFQDFWQSYPFQYLFKNYCLILLNAKKNLANIKTQAQKDNGAMFRQAVMGLEEAVKELQDLQNLSGRMVSLRMVLIGLKAFGKMLLISEAVLAALGILLFPVGGRMLAGSIAGDLAAKLADPMIQKNSMFIGIIFIAPVLALALTLWQLRND